MSRSNDWSLKKARFRSGVVEGRRAEFVKTVVKDSPQKLSNACLSTHTFPNFFVMHA